MITLVVTTRIGTVHAVRYGRSCGAVETASKRLKITANQAFVYHLHPCSACWPVAGEFAKHIGRTQ